MPVRGKKKRALWCLIEPSKGAGGADSEHGLERQKEEQGHIFERTKRVIGRERRKRGEGKKEPIRRNEKEFKSSSYLVKRKKKEDRGTKKKTVSQERGGNKETLPRPNTQEREKKERKRV